MKFSNIEELYKAHPILKEIAIRLDDSQSETNEYNRNGKKKDSVKKLVKNEDLPEGDTVIEVSTRFKQRYPEHFVFDRIFKHGGWERMAQLPKAGKKAYEDLLWTIVQSREPDGLHIDIQTGKTRRSVIDFTVFLNKSDEVVKQMEAADPKSAEVLNGIFEAKLQHFKNEIEQNKAGNPSSVEAITFKFEKEIMRLENERKIDSLMREYQSQIDAKDREIEELESEIEELEDQIAEQDGELGGLADKLEEKQKTPSIQKILAGAAEAAVTNLVVKNPSILKKGFGMSDEAIKEIVAEMQDNANKLESATDTNQNNGDASFKEASGDDYSGYSTEHAEALKSLISVIKSFDLNQFKLFYHVAIFCCEDTDNGTVLSEEKTKKIISFISSIVNNQNNG